MSTLSKQDFDRIVNYLKGLPKCSEPSDRKEHWRTADELLSLLPPGHPLGSPSQLDEALCARFVASEDCSIRFAYYPHEDTCKRLWGHVDNVGYGPGRSKLLVKLEMKPLPLEPDHLDDGVPIVFLSHTLEDHHFAARVRLSLARHGIRSWLAEGDMRETVNQPLFEAVEASLHRCHALIMLISSISVSSAWVYTEAQTALGFGKNVLGLIDASDAPICKFLQEWTSPKKGGAWAWLDSNEAVQSMSGVLERYMRVAPPNTRVLKFRTELECTLKSLTMSSVAFYPDVPQEWKGTTSWKGFEFALDGLGIQKAEAQV